MRDGPLNPRNVFAIMVKGLELITMKLTEDRENWMCLEEAYGTDKLYVCVKKLFCLFKKKTFQ